jgi:hypothetical protein
METKIVCLKSGLQITFRDTYTLMKGNRLVVAFSPTIDKVKTEEEQHELLEQAKLFIEENLPGKLMNYTFDGFNASLRTILIFTLNES